jgi:DNA-binding beta-propeller fold protein YncE
MRWWLGSLAMAVAMAAAAACGGGAGQHPSEPASASGSARGASCARRHPGLGAARLELSRQGGAVALARAGKTTLAYAADGDAAMLYTIDVDRGETRAATQLAGSPAQVLVLADGRVAVTLRDRNRVQILEPAAEADQPLEPLCSVKTYAEPYGIAASPDDRQIVVTSAWARRLTVYQSADMRLSFSRDLAREPRDVLVDDDGERAFVAHVVGGAVSVVPLAREEDELRTIDLRVPKLSNDRSGTLRNSCQGFALAKSVAPSGEAPLLDPETATRELTLRPERVPALPKGRVYAPRVTVEPGEPGQRSRGYGNARSARIEAPIVSVIDAAAERNMTSDLMTSVPGRGRALRGECLLPRAARTSASSGGLLVACAGTDMVVELDPRGNDPARLERRRWRVPSGPAGIAVDDARARAVVWSQFDRQLSVLDLRGQVATSVAVTSAPPLPGGKHDATVAWGRKLFHKTDDARISSDGRACASCHPDGREDALTWPTPVGPRQTLMLSGRIQGSAPYSWQGVHETVKVHLKITFERLGGTGLPDHPKRTDELDALVAYLEAMPAPRLAGALVDQPEGALAERGRELFHAEAQGCASCHIGGAGTDADLHDLGTRAAGDNRDEFETPSLRFVAGTAPYFHDGRYATLLDLLTATDSRMGHTVHLSRRDAEALAAYLETL